jgi:hypothetical protein
VSTLYQTLLEMSEIPTWVRHSPCGVHTCDQSEHSGGWVGGAHISGLSGIHSETLSQKQQQQKRNKDTVPALWMSVVQMETDKQRHNYNTELIKVMAVKMLTALPTLES